jgi:hypothetical protein
MYVQPALITYNSALWIYGFLILNTDYLFKQHLLLDICNGEVFCSLWSTDWILKYYLDEHQLQRVDSGDCGVLERRATMKI